MTYRDTQLARPWYAFSMYDTTGKQIVMPNDANLTGVHCVMEWKGKTLLGGIVQPFQREFPFPCVMLDVRFFNGEPWPIRPACSAVRMLLRDYDGEPSRDPEHHALTAKQVQAMFTAQDHADERSK